MAGGLVTLLTGASVASIIELVYFLTLRLWDEGGKVGLLLLFLLLHPPLFSPSSLGRGGEGDKV